MDIKLVIVDSKSGTPFDISDKVFSLSYTTVLMSEPGKLTFKYVDTSILKLKEGSQVLFYLDGAGIFKGYVFKKGIDSNNEVSVTAYDQMRYLKNKGIYQIKNESLTQVFKKLCAEFNLAHRIVDPTSFIPKPTLHDNKNLFDILNDMSIETLINTSKWHIIRDNFGILELIELESLKTNIMITDQKNLENFQYTSSIDEDTYNQVKLSKDNKEGKKRDVYIAKDSDTIAQYGILQYFDKINESTNEAQIKDRAEKILRQHNSPTKNLKFTSLGNIKVNAGNGITLSITDLSDEQVDINSQYLVTSCTHTFENENHTMKLEVKLPRNKGTEGY